jgi:hypothetical protein
MLGSCHPALDRQHGLCERARREQDFSRPEQGYVRPEAARGLTIMMLAGPATTHPAKEETNDKHT